MKKKPVKKTKKVMKAKKPVVKTKISSGKLNKWQLHVKATMDKNPDKKLAEVLKLAAKSYKK